MHHDLAPAWIIHISRKYTYDSYHNHKVRGAFRSPISLSVPVSLGLGLALALALALARSGLRNSEQRAEPEPTPTGSRKLEANAYSVQSLVCNPCTHYPHTPAPLHLHLLAARALAPVPAPAPAPTANPAPAPAPAPAPCLSVNRHRAGTLRPTPTARAPPTRPRVTPACRSWAAWATATPRSRRCWPRTSRRLLRRPPHLRAALELALS
jgi:hypothetical protein